MAAPFLKKFRIILGASGDEKEYYFFQNPTSYAGSLNTITGVRPATDTEQDEPEISVAALLKSGKAFRVNIRYTGGATGYKSAKILVARDKVGTALDSLIGKTFRGGQIVKASIPGKSQFI